MTKPSNAEKIMLEEFRPYFALLRAVMAKHHDGDSFHEKGLDEQFVGDAVQMCSASSKHFTDDNIDDFKEEIHEIWVTKYLVNIWDDPNTIPDYYECPTLVFPDGVFDEHPDGVLETEACKIILADFESTYFDTEEPQINHAAPEESKEKPEKPKVKLEITEKPEEPKEKPEEPEEKPEEPEEKPEKPKEKPEKPKEKPEKPTPTGEEETEKKDPRDSDPEWGLNGNEPPDLTDLPTRADSHLLNWEWFEAMAESEDLKDLPKLIADLHGKNLITTKRDMLDTLLFSLLAKKQIKLEDARKVFKTFDLLSE